MVRAALCLLAIPLLAACGDDPADAPLAGEDSRSASGDVLQPPSMRAFVGRASIGQQCQSHHRGATDIVQLRTISPVASVLAGGPAQPFDSSIDGSDRLFRAFEILIQIAKRSWPMGPSGCSGRGGRIGQEVPT